MGRPVWLVVGVLCLALVGTAQAAPAVPDDADGAAPVPESAALEDLDAPQQGQEHDSLQLELDVRHDGDVVWTYRYVYPVDAGEERQAFEDFAAQFESEETAFYREWRNQSEELTATASAELDRSMESTDFRREAWIDPTPTGDVGYVELSHRWTDFGQVEDGTVTVGDVFDGGFYLDEGQSLAFVAGENVTFQSVEPYDSSSGDLAERDSVSWTGRQQFPDEQPRATARVENASTDAVGGDTGTMGVTGPLMLGGGIAVLVLSLLVVAFVRGDLPELDSVRPDADDGAVGATSASTPQESTVPERADDAADGDDQSTDGRTALSDEQRVSALLEEHDGRMKQSAIVDETEWSKSKVSMLLSDMEDEDAISKIQVGRENIIALEGSEPEAASSPFDENE